MFVLLLLYAFCNLYEEISKYFKRFNNTGKEVFYTQILSQIL
jgi:hypothetical protein